MKGTNNTVINQFIIDASLIGPVSKIVDQLKNGEFRDCDIKWLDAKLEKFSVLACKTLRVTVGIMPQEKGKILNDYTAKQYLERFTILLEYFKRI